MSGGPNQPSSSLFLYMEQHSNFNNVGAYTLGTQYTFKLCYIV